MNDFFKFGKTIEATTDTQLHNLTFKKLWNSFCFTKSEIVLKKGAKNTFVIGNIALPILKDNKEYALSVTENGIAVVGADYNSLMRGIASLLMKIDYICLESENPEFKIRTIEETSNYHIKNRMIHICVFPETDLYFVKKLIRLAAICQYTHIVLEFWGMLKYDCLKELACLVFIVCFQNAFFLDIGVEQTFLHRCQMVDEIAFGALDILGRLCSLLAIGELPLARLNLAVVQIFHKSIFHIAYLLPNSFSSTP